jgi:hypothetical protein
MRVGDKVRIITELDQDCWDFMVQGRVGELVGIEERDPSAAEFTHHVKLDLGDWGTEKLYFKSSELEPVEPPTTKTFSAAVTLSRPQIEQAEGRDVEQVVEDEILCATFELRNSIYEWVEQVRPEPDPLDVLNEARDAVLNEIVAIDDLIKGYNIVGATAKLWGLVGAYGGAAITLGKAEASS